MRTGWKYILGCMVLMCLLAGCIWEKGMLISACGAERSEREAGESVEKDPESKIPEESDQETSEETEESSIEETDESESGEIAESETEEMSEPLETVLTVESPFLEGTKYYREDVILTAVITGGRQPISDIRWHFRCITADTEGDLDISGSCDELENLLETYGLGSVEKEDDPEKPGEVFRMILTAEGCYDIQLSAEDSEGSTDESEMCSFIIDRTAPSLCVEEISETSAGNGIYGIGDVPVLSVLVQEFCTQEMLSGIDRISYCITDSHGFREEGCLRNSDDGEAVVKWQGYLRPDLDAFADGRLEIVVKALDQAGNEGISETVVLEVDQREPAVSFFFDTSDRKGEKYYSSEKELMILVEDDHFDQGCLPVVVSDQRNGYIFSGWKCGEGRAEGTIHFSEDGEYSVSFSCRDLAGNSARMKILPGFIIDQTNPELIIKGVDDHSSNKGRVTPEIFVYDENIEGSIRLALIESEKGPLDIQAMIHRVSDEHGESVTFDDFGSEMDGIYTLRADARDLAGNQTVREIKFTVNRNGSDFAFSSAARQLFDRVFIRQPEDIIVYEHNVDWVIDKELSLTCSGEIRELTEGQDYQTAVSGSEDRKKQYTYRIPAETFKTEGTYNIHLYSRDGADNVSSIDAGNSGAEFILDFTAPMITVVDLEERQYYHEDEHEFTAIISDNTVLDQVRYYLDDELIASYGRDELEASGGILYLKTGSSDDYQTIRLEAVDAAGNQSGPEEWHVLVNHTRQTVREKKPDFNELTKEISTAKEADVPERTEVFKTVIGILCILTAAGYVLRKRLKNYVAGFLYKREK